MTAWFCFVFFFPNAGLAVSFLLALVCTQCKSPQTESSDGQGAGAGGCHFPTLDPSPRRCLLLGPQQARESESSACTLSTQDVEGRILFPSCLHSRGRASHAETQWSHRRPPLPGHASRTCLRDRGLLRARTGLVLRLAFRGVGRHTAVCPHQPLSFAQSAPTRRRS